MSTLSSPSPLHLTSFADVLADAMSTHCGNAGVLLACLDALSALAGSPSNAKCLLRFVEPTADALAACGDVCSVQASGLTFAGRVAVGVGEGDRVVLAPLCDVAVAAMTRHRAVVAVQEAAVALLSHLVGSAEVVARLRGDGAAVAALKHTPLRSPQADVSKKLATLLAQAPEPAAGGESCSVM